MRTAQPPWSVSTPALAAIVACLEPVALAGAPAATRVIGAHRAVLVDGLAALALPVAGSPSTPFVLVDTSSIGSQGFGRGGLGGKRILRWPGGNLSRFGAGRGK